MTTSRARRLSDTVHLSESKGSDSYSHRFSSSSFSLIRPCRLLRGVAHGDCLRFYCRSHTINIFDYCRLYFKLAHTLLPLLLLLLIIKHYRATYLTFVLASASAFLLSPLTTEARRDTRRRHRLLLGAAALAAPLSLLCCFYVD